VTRAARWLFLDRRTGRITVAQWPNVALWVFIALSIALRSIRPTGTTESVLGAAADVALVLWAIDELLRGVNPFRRILGAGVLLLTITNLTFWSGWP
jgi:hypothetical protein